MRRDVEEVRRLGGQDEQGAHALADPDRPLPPGIRHRALGAPGDRHAGPDARSRMPASWRSTRWPMTMPRRRWSSPSSIINIGGRSPRSATATGTAIRRRARSGLGAADRHAQLPGISVRPLHPRPASIAEVMETRSGWKPAQGVRVGSLLNPTSVVQVLPNWDEWSQQVPTAACTAGSITAFPTRRARRSAARRRGSWFQPR